MAHRMPLVALAVLGLVNVQKPSQTPKEPRQIQKALEEARATISSQRPEIPPQVLKADQQMIVQVFPDLERSYKLKGFSDRDTHGAVVWTWEALRVGPGAVSSAAPIQKDVFLKKAEDQGKLVVNSDPAEANIQVDDSVWKKTTNTEGFADTGTRRVRVSLTNYQPAEAQCQIEKERVAKFNANLGSAKSAATCK